LVNAALLNSTAISRLFFGLILVVCHSVVVGSKKY
jgi:hypothetical protein